MSQSIADGSCIKYCFSPKKGIIYGKNKQYIYLFFFR